MTIVRRFQTRVQRWHLLGRYYVNKWHYDGSKWAERVWYGQGSTGNGPQVASVAFMITRSMRQQLLDAGFPPSSISTLQPAVAQKIIADQITFAQFEQLQKQQMEEVGERAKQVLQQEEEQNALHVVTNNQEPEQDQIVASALVAGERAKQVLQQEEQNALHVVTDNQEPEQDQIVASALVVSEKVDEKQS
ncbi:hypothetical protein PHMEG_00023146 [Phytophthora megakarya]|uniref:Uncharacterized protein n=1 Tax=Phytophthora megakarya TaxID=4795 RepID=A0A225VJF0_9STRA|nr:hypothetical protein PHMEG_00023146 [Phytophthora megakarya]